MNTDEDEQIKEVYAHFGLAVYLAQVLEHALVIALVYSDLLPNRTPSTTQAHFDVFMDKHFSTTMGKMIKNLQQFMPIPAELGTLLTESRTKRNWLAHHYFRERADEFMTEKGREKMLIELKDAQTLFEKADELLDEVCRPLREKFGLTDEKIEKHFKEYVEKNIETP